MAFDWSGAIQGAYKKAQGMSKNWMNSDNSGPMQGGMISSFAGISNPQQPIEQVGIAPETQQQQQVQQTTTRKPRVLKQSTKRPKTTKIVKTPYQTPGSPNLPASGNLRYRGG